MITTIKGNYEVIKGSQRGLGLIELVIALSLLSVVLAAVYSYYFFGNRSFSTGEAQQNLQQNVRHASAFVTNEIRFASEVEILSENPLSFESGWYYIYLKDGDEENIFFRSDDGEKPIPGIITDDTSYDSGALVFNGAGSNVLQFTISASNNDQNYNIESQVQPLNISGSIGGSNNGVAVRYRKDIPTGGGSNTGDPLPAGYFAFIDLNDNRVYDEGTDIPVPLADLIEKEFTTIGYTNDYNADLIGTGGSLIIPAASGDILVPNIGVSKLNWFACQDVFIGVNIEHLISATIRIEAGRNFYLSEGVSIETTGSGINIVSANNFSAAGATMNTSNGGSKIIIESSSGVININNAEINCNGSGGIDIIAETGISAEGAVMNNTNGGGTIKLESKTSGNININGARLNDNQINNCGGVEITGNGDLFAANSIINSKSNADTTINIQGNINLDDTILDTGASGKIDISGGGSFSAERSKMTSRGNAGIEIDIDGFIILNHAQIPDSSLTVNTGHINIKSNNAGIEANNAFIAAVFSSGLRISMTANDDLQINHADLRVQVDNDIGLITDGQLYVDGLELSYNNIGKNASAKTHNGVDVPSININGSIALGTINNTVVDDDNNGDDDNGDNDDPEPWEPNDEFPEWVNKVYNGGLKVTYNGNRYISRQYIHANTGNPEINWLWILQPLPNEDYPRWRSIEPYAGESRVIHQAMVYRAKWWANAGVEPPNSPWELVN